MRVAKIFVVALTTTLILGCGGVSDSVGYVADTPIREWREGVSIEIPNDDTLSRRDIDIFVKHQPQCELESVRLRIYTSSPDNTIHYDDVTLPLHRSTWGRRSSSQVNISPYRKDVVWRQRGIYKVDIFPIDTIAQISGIEAVGLTISRTNE